MKFEKLNKKMHKLFAVLMILFLASLHDLVFFRLLLHVCVHICVYMHRRVFKCVHVAGCASTVPSASEMELFVIIVNIFQSLTDAPGSSVLDVAWGLNVPLTFIFICVMSLFCTNLYK